MNIAKMIHAFYSALSPEAAEAFIKLSSIEGALTVAGRMAGRFASAALDPSKATEADIQSHIDEINTSDDFDYHW